MKYYIVEFITTKGEYHILYKGLYVDKFVDGYIKHVTGMSSSLGKLKEITEEVYSGINKVIINI